MLSNYQTIRYLSRRGNRLNIAKNTFCIAQFLAAKICVYVVIPVSGHIRRGGVGTSPRGVEAIKRQSRILTAEL